jgi:anaphase-promoting complex subunit 5
MQAVGLYDHWIDVQLATPVEAEQWGQHAVQAYVWRLIGSEHVAAAEENVVTAFTEVGGDDNNRFTVTLNRAYKVGHKVAAKRL